MNAVQKLRQLADEIKGASDPFAKVDAWSLVERLMLRTPGVNLDELSRVLEVKDAAGLDAIVYAIEHPEQRKQESKPKIDTSGVTEAEMRSAMKAFRKRLKLGRLADESRLGGRYTSGGRKSGIDAIIAPTDYPTPVWAALVEKGELEYTGDGFYALPGVNERKRPDPI